MRKARSVEEQKSLYEKYKRSGLNSKKFCKENKVSTRSIWLWGKKFERNIADKKSDYSDHKSNPIQKPDNIKFYSIGKLKDVVHKKTQLKVNLPNGVSIDAALSKRELDLLLQELIKWR